MAQFHRAASAPKVVKAKTNDAYQNKITSQSTMAHVPFVTGILIIFAEQETFKHNFLLLKQLYEIGPRLS